MNLHTITLAIFLTVAFVGEGFADEQLNNTLIVFRSDNGGKLGLGADNTPLKKGKGSTYDGGFRVPMFFHWPNQVAKGKRYDHPVTAIDFYPTFSRLARAKILSDKLIDGKDIWDDLLRGKSAREGEMVFAMRHRRGFNDGGARLDDWKITRSYRQPWKLFNIKNDISESHDLSHKHPELLREMIARVQSWSQSHAQPRWFDNLTAESAWKSDEMPRHHETFEFK